MLAPPARGTASHDEGAVRNALTALRATAVRLALRADALAREFSHDYFSAVPRPRTRGEVAAARAALPEPEVGHEVLDTFAACSRLAGPQHAPSILAALLAATDGAEARAARATLAALDATLGEAAAVAAATAALRAHASD